MAEARRLKGGRWRLYVSPELRPVRDPQTGTIVTFDSIEAARRWWRHLGLAEPPPHGVGQVLEVPGLHRPIRLDALCGALLPRVPHAPGDRRSAVTV